ncbi:MAG: hypothetical protein DRP06_02825 [Candidatus Aenigmatarchaeota archaeon]|nr:MAG: hypothetical protein DRP06_02825 [Candidatus Aenigmarchaeota archaeon]
MTNIKIITILAILMIGILMTSGCTQTEESNSNNNPTPSGNMEDNPADKPNDNLENNVKPDADDWCSIGTYVTGSTGKMTVTGIENHKIQGNTMELCCSESEFTGEDFEMKQKVCYTQDEDYSLMWQSTPESNELVLFSESYPQGDKLCVKVFNPDGSILMEACD